MATHKDTAQPDTLCTRIFCKNMVLKHDIFVALALTQMQKYESIFAFPNKISIFFNNFYEFLINVLETKPVKTCTI